MLFEPAPRQPMSELALVVREQRVGSVADQGVPEHVFARASVAAHEQDLPFDQQAEAAGEVHALGVLAAQPPALREEVGQQRWVVLDCETQTTTSQIQDPLWHHSDDNICGGNASS